MLAQKEIMQEDFDSHIIMKIWRKGDVIFDINPDIIRRDFYGDWIKRDDYENPHSAYGWVIVHIKPESGNGNGEIKDLHPIHWKNSRTVL